MPPQQIQIQQTASQVYLSAAAYFARDNVALPVRIAASRIETRMWVM